MFNVVNYFIFVKVSWAWRILVVLVEETIDQQNFRVITPPKPSKSRWNLRMYIENRCNFNFFFESDARNSKIFVFKVSSILTGTNVSAERPTCSILSPSQKSSTWNFAPKSLKSGSIYWFLHRNRAKSCFIEIEKNIFFFSPGLTNSSVVIWAIWLPTPRTRTCSVEEKKNNAKLRLAKILTKT